jgi:hypothetical protein
MTLLLAICLFTAEGRSCDGASLQMRSFAECRETAAAIRANMPPTHKVIWHECASDRRLKR